MMRRAVIVLCALAAALLALPALADHGWQCLGSAPVRHAVGSSNYTGSDSAECVGEADGFHNTAGHWILNGGNDQAYAGGGADFVEGNEGNDGPLQGGLGPDLIIGGKGNDRLAEAGSGQGGSDNSPDELRGNGGNDTLYGGGGGDILLCGPGSFDAVYHLHDGVDDFGDGSCESHFHT